MVKAVTLKDLAKTCDVTYRVVAEIMGGHQSGSRGIHFSEVTRERVVSAAQKLGYKANRNARNLQRQGHNAVGIYAKTSFFIGQGLVEGLIAACQECKIMPIMEMLPDNGDLPVSLKEHCIDGALFFGNSFNKQLQNHLRSIPSILVNSNSIKDICSLQYDEADAMAQAVAEFARSGKKNIAYFDKESPHYSWQARMDALKKYCKQAHMAEPICIVSKKNGKQQPQNFEEMRSYLRAGLREYPHIDAFIANDLDTPIVYSVLQETNRNIVEDCAYIALGDSKVAKRMSPAATTLTIRGRKLGQRVIGLLSDTIKGHAVQTAPVPYVLTRREST